MPPFFFAPETTTTATTAKTTTVARTRTPTRKKRIDRPKGLWKARVTLSAPPRCLVQEAVFHDSSDTDIDEHEQHQRQQHHVGIEHRSQLHEHEREHEEFEVGSSSGFSRSRVKRRRLSRSRSRSLSPTDSNSNFSVSSGTSSGSGEEVFLLDFARKCAHSPPPPLTTTNIHSHTHHTHRKRESSWTRRTRIMDTSSLVNVNSTKGVGGGMGLGGSTAGMGPGAGEVGQQPQVETKSSCDYEDWEDLKDLFAKAVEQYESDDASEALPLIRGVVHECHRFLLFYQDPSVLFTNPNNIPGHSPETLTPPDERLHRDWAGDANCEGDKKVFGSCKCVELPTAFHAILGTALFLFGNLIAQDRTLALPGEPNTPTQYWLSALDVFETGENLPSKTSGRGAAVPEDWRMAIVWGRTLVCLADEAVTRAQRSPAWPSSTTPMSTFGLATNPVVSDEEPNWPPESPFYIIAQRRPPVTRRMSLTRASANDLMKLAMDQFSRGIFHMPHPHHIAPTGKPSSSSGVAATPLGSAFQQESFSRAKELYTIASEVLLLAEKFDVTSERQYWASWADSVFNQMKMEADVDTWRGAINRSRGRCCLIVGTARAEEFEDALDRGDEAVLQSEDAEEAREALRDAVSFFEKAKGSATVDEEEVEGDEELRHLLAEALITLANLSTDEGRREELYARAEKESGGQLDLGLGDKMDES